MLFWNRSTSQYFKEYRRVNDFLSELCTYAVEILHNNGFKALAVEPTVENMDYGTLAAPFSHKTAALRAGFGWIGKSALLITEQYGPAVRLATVLCDVELEVENSVQKSQCGSCRECVIHCPAKALTGKNWETGFERAVIYDAYACCTTAEKLSNRLGVKATICGICINVCPWTRKYIQRKKKDSA